MWYSKVRGGRNERLKANLDGEEISKILKLSKIKEEARSKVEEMPSHFYRV